MRTVSGNEDTFAEESFPEESASLIPQEGNSDFTNPDRAAALGAFGGLCVGAVAGATVGPISAIIGGTTGMVFGAAICGAVADRLVTLLPRQS